ncbi:DUF4157 domain-containing protein [Streptomyces monashensis]|uniref:eCIS core domain-containing protein n=1 Tax=Streptomyces monashensis TaxID=1678012 RepID=UPI0033FFDC6B
MLRRTAEDRRQHSGGCGHQPDEQPAVQRSAVHEVLRTPGRPLDDVTRSDMESRLGADFSDVRLHTDAAARASADEVGARAYTSGSHIVIGEGGGDRHTLAHELTHVIQQRRGPVAGTDHGDGLSVSHPSDRFEREAEANARRALSRSGTRSVSPGHESAGAGGGAHGPGMAVQRFMAPDPVGVETEWKATAQAYVRANFKEIAARYARTVLELGEDAAVDRKTMGRIFQEMRGVDPAWERLKMVEVLARVNGTAPAEAADITAILRCLNVMEEESELAKTSSEQDWTTPLKESLVGTEFTFSDSVLSGQTGIGSNPPYPLRVDTGGLTGVEDASAERTLTYASNKARAWRDRVAADPLPAGFGLEVTGVTVKERPGFRFTYTSGNSAWWWEITMDDGCLETRTAPLSVEGMGAAHIRSLVRTHVFEAAAGVGLVVDQSRYGGGGHLSLDSRTTFGASVELFVESMRKWESDWKAWKTAFGSAPRESDTVNAPWTGDLPGNHLPALLDRLTEIRDEARSGHTNLTKAIRDLQAHLVELPLHADATQMLREKVDEHPGDRLHYQAVNLEHMGEDTPEAERRVEFRDIQAQRDYAQLMQDLGYLGRLLLDVRAEVRGTQRDRLAARHS